MYNSALESTTILFFFVVVSKLQLAFSFTPTDLGKHLKLDQNLKIMEEKQLIVVKTNKRKHHRFSFMIAVVHSRTQR